MALGRTFTKRLQKFNVVGRKSRSNSTNQSPTSEHSISPSSNNNNNNNGDYFHAISFEQTAEGSDVECESLSNSDNNSTNATSPREPVTPSSFTDCQARIYNSESPSLDSSHNNSLDIQIKTRERADTSISLSNAMQFYPPPRRILSSNNNTGDNSSVSSVYSSSVTNSPSLNDDALFINETSEYTSTTTTATNASSSFVDVPSSGLIETVKYVNSEELRPEELQKLEEDAKADEMAMNILEKVSADDYVRELKTGSWYI